MLSPDGEVPRVQTLRSQATHAPGGMAGDEGKTRRRGTVVSSHISFHIFSKANTYVYNYCALKCIFHSENLTVLIFFAMTHTVTSWNTIFSVEL